MNTTLSEQPLKTQSTNSSLATRMSNVIACPEDVMDEIDSGTHAPKHWITSILLAALANYFCFAMTLANHSASQETSGLENIVVLMNCLIMSFLGALYSALVFWILGRWALQARFRYSQALEVVGATSVIAALGWIVTLFLRLALNDASTLPALSLFQPMDDEASKWSRILESLNLFHLWSTLLLSLGLARLSKSSFGESAFWAFGYWIVLRAALA